MTTTGHAAETSASPITLNAGAWRCGVAPERGGAITWLDLGDRAVLRRANANTATPFALASFSLVPYANRIAHGRLRTAEADIILPPNLPGEAHPLHGIGFLTPWSVAARSGEAVTLILDHPGSASWPWAFRSRQEVRLDGKGLLCSLEIVNTDDRPAPAGLGFHPYFPLARSARLLANLGGVWLADADQLPTVHQKVLLRDWSGGAAVQGDTLIDHCHTGWDGVARIDWPDFSVMLTASPTLDMLHVYAPPGADFFCIEPVSHRPDAINAPDPVADGVRFLAPGAAMAVWMRIDATRT